MVTFISVFFLSAKDLPSGTDESGFYFALAKVMVHGRPGLCSFVWFYFWCMLIAFTLCRFVPRNHEMHEVTTHNGLRVIRPGQKRKLAVNHRRWNGMQNEVRQIRAQCTWWRCIPVPSERNEIVIYTCRRILIKNIGVLGFHINSFGRGNKWNLFRCTEQTISLVASFSSSVRASSSSKVMRSRGHFLSTTPWTFCRNFQGTLSAASNEINPRPRMIATINSAEWVDNENGEKNDKFFPEIFWTNKNAFG